jgi:hypothetical protein
MILVMKVEIGKFNIKHYLFLSFSIKRKTNRQRRYIDKLTSSDSDPDEVRTLFIEYIFDLFI